MPSALRLLAVALDALFAYQDEVGSRAATYGLGPQAADAVPVGAVLASLEETPASARHGDADRLLDESLEALGAFVEATADQDLSVELDTDAPMAAVPLGALIDALARLKHDLRHELKHR